MSEKKAKAKVYDLLEGRAPPSPVNPVQKVLEAETADLGLRGSFD